AALGVVLGRLLGKRVIVTLHGLGTLDSSVSKHILWRLYRFVSLKWADIIIATSAEMAQVAMRFAPQERVVVIPNGVDTDRFAPRTRPPTGDEIVILTMRRLAPKNGVQYLVEAAPLILEAVPQARFWLTGEGKLEAHIRRRVAELGLEPFVHFLGIVAHDQTPGYYAQADIVVFPSSAESTSLACLEAMSMEKAVVASRLSAYREMLGDDELGLLVPLFEREASDYNAPLTLPPERIQALAYAVIRLAQDPPLRQRLGQAARAFVMAGYDWRLVAARTARLYGSPGGAR
ncbi:MAG: glycosyltransferase family 4 protein, partial [Chloroflexi bacterium]|nr:glycosyltransferase family 4 protein [Chloroflexota bacterium]